jgi:hypothetical protein
MTRLVALHVLADSWAKLELSLSALEMLGLSCYAPQHSNPLDKHP